MHYLKTKLPLDSVLTVTTFMVAQQLISFALHVFTNRFPALNQN